MRHCYVCGREGSRRIIAEPLMLPVCFESECARIATRLAELHCSARGTDGRLCGAPAVAQVQTDGQRLCAGHLQAAWDNVPRVKRGAVEASGGVSALYSPERRR
jgi:hypothetical protein